MLSAKSRCNKNLLPKIPCVLRKRLISLSVISAISKLVRLGSKPSKEEISFLIVSSIEEAATSYASCSGRKEYARNGLRWPYENMAAVLNGTKSLATGKNNEAPVQDDDLEYLMGKKGFQYDDGDNECGEKDCGDEPHTGYWFTFEYYWADDDDTY